MPNPYTPPTLTGYNASAPSDDGQRTASNAVRWATHLAKIGNPLKTYTQAISAAITAAFDALTQDDIPYRRTAAEIAAGVTPTNSQYQEGHLYRYGTNAIPGTTDMLAAFNAMASVGAITKYVYVPNADLFVSGRVLLDLGDDAVIEWDGRLTSSHTGSDALTIGPASGSSFSVSVIGAGLHVSRTSISTSASTTGIQIRNCHSSEFKIRWVTGYRIGLFVNGSSGGASLNKFYLGWINDSLFNLFLAASGTGYCNENSFYGGEFGYTSDYGTFDPTYAGTYDIYVDYFASSPLNNNKFFGPSLECAVAAATVAFQDYGENTHIYSPRIEAGSGTATDFKIVLATESKRAFIVGGATLLLANITENSSEKSNTYLCVDGAVFGSTAAANGTMHTVRSSGADSTTRGYRVLDTSDAEAWRVHADGSQFGRRLGLRDNTVTYSASMTPNAALGQRQIITATDGNAFTINAPSNPPAAAPYGQRLTITLRNTSGGALGAATWDAIYKMSTWTNPATGFNRSIDFWYDSTNWIQLAQTGVDVPN